MPNTRELDRELTERLYDLLKIKNANSGMKNSALEDAIKRAKASMTKEQIAWVEALISD